MTERGKKSLIQLEGLKLEVYDDAAGLKSIGIGHLLTRDELSSGKIELRFGAVINYRQGISADDALRIMDADLMPASLAVARSVKVTLTDNQRDALVLFSFNVGTRAFEQSTLLKQLNDGQYSTVPEQMRRWVFAGGVKLDGLMNRREAEIRIWNAA